MGCRVGVVGCCVDEVCWCGVLVWCGGVWFVGVVLRICGWYLFWWVGVVWCVGVLASCGVLVCWCGGGGVCVAVWCVGEWCDGLGHGVWCCVCVSTLQKTYCQDLWISRSKRCVVKMCGKEELYKDM